MDISTTSYCRLKDESTTSYSRELDISTTSYCRLKDESTTTYSRDLDISATSSSRMQDDYTNSTRLQDISTSYSRQLETISPWLTPQQEVE